VGDAVAVPDASAVWEAVCVDVAVSVVVGVLAVAETDAVIVDDAVAPVVADIVGDGDAVLVGGTGVSGVALLVGVDTAVCEPVAVTVGVDSDGVSVIVAAGSLAKSNTSAVRSAADVRPSVFTSDADPPAVKIARMSAVTSASLTTPLPSVSPGTDAGARVASTHTHSKTTNNKRPANRALTIACS